MTAAPPFGLSTRFLFFTGKGGVGKTSIACATAVELAGRGQPVLLVSTDPASNLDEMLGAPLTNHAVPVPGVAGLSVLNIDPDAASEAYRQRVLARLGADASDLQPDEIIPATGLIDSAGLLELIAWFEASYAFKIPAEELTIDNLGSLQAMAAYLRRRKGLA